MNKQAKHLVKGERGRLNATKGKYENLVLLLHSVVLTVLICSQVTLQHLFL